MTPTRTQQRQQGGNGRQGVALWNHQAEASLLGAALNSAQAVEALLEWTRPEDFTKPEHVHVAAAIRDVSERGAAVDPVTVADQLQRAGFLDHAGGQYRLIELQAGAPSLSRAPHYAQIVARDARLRRISEQTVTIHEALRQTGELDQGALDRLMELATFDAAGLPHSLEQADVAAILRGDHALEEPFWWRRDDGRALVYPGRMHWLQAEPSVGKSNLALAITADVLHAGGTVVYLDWEDIPTAVVGRLIAIGAQPDDIAGRFDYYNPAGAIGPPERAHLAALADQRPDLVVCDGVAEALARDGLSEDKAPDVVGWIEKIPRPFARAGAAVLMLDHVTKDREGRSRWARGSGAKLGAVDGAAYEVVVHRAYNRHQAGAVRLIVAKDRPGAVGAIGETVAHVTITPSDGGAQLAIRPLVPAPELTEFHPTDVMGKITALLAESDQALTKNGIASTLPGHKRATVLRALDDLVRQGFVSRVPGPNRSQLHSLIRPFDEAAIEPEELF